MLSLLEWALQVTIRAFFLLLLAILLAFVWNLIMHALSGPHVDYIDIAFIVAIISVGVGSWGFTLLRRTTTTQ